MIELSKLIQYPAERNRPSPNFGSRHGNPIRFIILHATAGGDEGAETWMTSPDSKVSAHLHIRRDGSITRHVQDQDRAWHAGVGSWQGIDDLNTVSLGWEIGNYNDGRDIYTDAQYWAVARLLAHYLPQGIDKSDVLSHALVAPRRKTDPYAWDWTRMWLALAVIQRPVPKDITFEPVIVTYPRRPPAPVLPKTTAQPWWRRLLTRLKLRGDI